MFSLTVPSSLSQKVISLLNAFSLLSCVARSTYDLKLQNNPRDSAWLRVMDNRKTNGDNICDNGDSLIILRMYGWLIGMFGVRSRTNLGPSRCPRRRFTSIFHVEVQYLCGEVSYLHVAFYLPHWMFRQELQPRGRRWRARMPTKTKGLLPEIGVPTYSAILLYIAPWALRYLPPPNKHNQSLMARPTSTSLHHQPTLFSLTKSACCRTFATAFGPRPSV